MSKAARAVMTTGLILTLWTLAYIAGISIAGRL